jgi:hypothetical protein
MRRKLVVSAVIAVIGILGTTGTAFANDCVNLSRPFNPNTQEGEVKGRWLPIDEPFLGGETWLFLSPDNFMNGQDDAILGNAACPAGRLVGQSKGEFEPANLHGIWSEECFDKAFGDL